MEMTPAVASSFDFPDSDIDFKGFFIYLFSSKWPKAKCIRI